MSERAVERGNLGSLLVDVVLKLLEEPRFVLIMINRLVSRLDSGHKEYPGEQHDGDNDGTNVKAKLSVGAGISKISTQNTIVNKKIDPRKEHENDNHPIDEIAVVVSDRSVLGREPAGSHRSESVTQCVEPVHSSEQK